MSKIINSGLDKYGDEPFEQQQFVTAGVEGIKAGSKQFTRDAYVLKCGITSKHTVLKLL